MKKKYLFNHYCQICGRGFQSAGAETLYCSPECRRKAKEQSFRNRAIWRKPDAFEGTLNPFQKRFVTLAAKAALMAVGGNKMLWQDSIKCHKDGEICHWCGKEFIPFSRDEDGRLTGKLFCCISCASVFNAAVNAEMKRMGEKTSEKRRTRAKNSAAW